MRHVNASWGAGLFFLCCLFGQPAHGLSESTITVESNARLGPVNPLLFGQNVLFAGNGGAMWDLRSNGLQPQAAVLVDGIRPAVLRFPGGSNADMYFWETALGARLAEPVWAGGTTVKLDGVPAWNTATDAYFIDGTWGQFGDGFRFSGIVGAELQGVTGIEAMHSVGIEVRPGAFQGQPSWFSHTYGIDEHMKLVERLGASPIMTVNYGSGRDRTGAVSVAASLSQKIKRAMAWVAYLNGSPTDTGAIGIDGEGTDWKTVGYWASKRQERGHPDPYQVQDWEIGNEVYGSWETGFTTARRYAEDFVQFATAMKTVDPTIRVGAVGYWNPHGVGDADSAEEWNATVIQVAGGSLDFLSLNMYYPAAGRAQVTYGSGTWYGATLAGASQALSDLREVRSIMATHLPDAPRVQVSVTEYNIHPFDSTDARDWSNLANALFYGDLLMGLMEEGVALNVRLAAAWTLHDSSSLSAAIHFDWATGTRWTRPQWSTLQLLRNYLAPDLVRSTVQSQTISTPQAGNVAAVTGLPVLRALATADDAGRVTLLVLNRSSSQITVTVRCADCIPQASVTIRTLAGKQLGANNEDNHGAVVLATGTRTLSVKTEQTGASFGYAFPGYSLTLLELQGNQGSPGAPPSKQLNKKPSKR